MKSICKQRVFTGCKSGGVFGRNAFESGTVSPPALVLLALLALLLSLVGCGAIFGPGSGSHQYLDSGTIIISHMVPERPAAGDYARGRLAADALTSTPALSSSSTTAVAGAGFSPLIGYFPPVSSYVPADNETWLEIKSQSKKVLLHKGKSVIKEIQAEGEVSIDEGKYYLHHKQKQPLWYASDQYFEKRQLDVPRPGDRMRYRKGALGKYALYPTTTFPIHCGAVWSEDVGGLKLTASDLSSIYYMLPVGATIVVSQ